MKDGDLELLCHGEICRRLEVTVLPDDDWTTFVPR